MMNSTELNFKFFRLLRNWKKEAMKPKKYSLVKVVMKTFWKEYALMSFLAGFGEIFVKLGQPLLLGRLLLYFRWKHIWHIQTKTNIFHQRHSIINSFYFVYSVEMIRMWHIMMPPFLPVECWFCLPFQLLRIVKFSSWVTTLEWKFE